MATGVACRQSVWQTGHVGVSARGTPLFCRRLARAGVGAGARTMGRRQQRGLWFATLCLARAGPWRRRRTRGARNASGRGGVPACASSCVRALAAAGPQGAGRRGRQGRRARAGAAQGRHGRRRRARHPPGQLQREQRRQGPHRGRQPDAGVRAALRPGGAQRDRCGALVGGGGERERESVCAPPEGRLERRPGQRSVGREGWALSRLWHLGAARRKLDSALRSALGSRWEQALARSHGGSLAQAEGAMVGVCARAQARRRCCVRWLRTTSRASPRSARSCTWSRRWSATTRPSSRRVRRQGLAWCQAREVTRRAGALCSSALALLLSSHWARVAPAADRTGGLVLPAVAVADGRGFPAQAVLACDVERTELLEEEASIQAQLHPKVRRGPVAPPHRTTAWAG